MKPEVVSIAKALGDDSRLRILMCLDGSTLCQSQITEILGLSASTVSQHVGILCAAGLLVEHREGRWHYYRWPRDGVSTCLGGALAWVRAHAADDPLIVADAAKRAVVMRNSAIPCPGDAKARVLFLCTGNSCRSQMAEAMLRAYSGGRFEVHSAGLTPKPIHDMTYTVMDEIGIDIRQQHATDVMQYLGKVHFGYLITVCAHAEAQCPIFPGISQRLYWPVPDPAEVSGTRAQRLDAFRRARDTLRGKIRDWLSEQGIEVNALTRKEV
jgi:protein-tyrosine-phosphatase/DNA-binding transcriptional ArsR family regulator